MFSGSIKVSTDTFLPLMLIKFMRSLVAPGEPVGVLAGQVSYLREVVKFTSTICFMEIATAKAEATNRTGLPHTQTHIHPSTQPLTWQHDIKSLPHREQVDEQYSTSSRHRNNLLLPQDTLCGVQLYEISLPRLGFEP